LGEERRYNFYSFSTSALDGGEWSASRPGRALHPGNEPPVPIVQEAGWTPEPVWTQRLEEKSSASVGDRTPVVQSVATPDHLRTECLGEHLEPKRDEVREGWRKLHSEELHNLYSSLNIPIIRMIMSRRMRWAGHGERMGEMRNAYNILARQAE
jgi:hypothetical protein